MTQASLFQSQIEQSLSVPVARRSDPATSRMAAEEVTRSGRREGQLLAVLALVRKYPLSTSMELANRSNLDRYAVARRLPELASSGLVLRRASRICTVARREAITWEAR